MATLRDEPRPDLFVGLIGAVGATLSNVVEAIKVECSSLSYDVVAIRLSDLLKDVELSNPQSRALDDLGEDDRINALMDAGNEIRKRSGTGDAVLQLGVRELKRVRAAKKRRGNQSGTVYVFWSLKHPDEVKALRRIYKASCHIISVYSPKHVRRNTLCSKIQRHKPSISKKDLNRKVDELIERDQNEVGIDHGQNVRDAFYLADLFVDGTIEVRPQIERYIRLLFGDPFITPSIDEYGMFHAKAASLRSADLSRQVGAMILTEDGSHLAAGCNEVPKSGGGHYWPDIDPVEQDNRDFRHGSDMNTVMRSEMLGEVIDVLKSRDWLKLNYKKDSTKRLVADLLTGKRPNLSDTRIANVIEYGRIVHAEMSAITDAARKGTALEGARLVCTTFPCHMCTRHIIAAGIGEVVFIEPYPKSLAVELYGASIRVDDEKAEQNDVRVHFRPFIGVSPYRYTELFSYRKRKDGDGFVKDWKPTAAMRPITSEPYIIYKPAETLYTLSGAALAAEAQHSAAKSKGRAVDKKAARVVSRRNTARGTR